MSQRASVESAAVEPDHTAATQAVTINQVFIMDLLSAAEAETLVKDIFRERR
jgi:hypothetical protein